MPRDIGPDMLANLDRQLAAGNIDQAKYDARRAEVLELIRKGRAVEHNSAERLMRRALAIILILLGAYFIAATFMGGSQTFLGYLVGALIIAAGAFTWRRTH